MPCALQVMFWHLILLVTIDVSLDSTFFLPVFSLAFPPTYSLLCHRPKQLYSSANKSNIYSQQTEGDCTVVTYHVDTENPGSS